MSTSYDIGTLAQLKDGKLPFDKVHAMMSGFKTPTASRRCSGFGRKA